jgi:hypothetical protein
MVENLTSENQDGALIKWMSLPELPPQSSYPTGTGSTLSWRQLDRQPGR